VVDLRSGLSPVDWLGRMFWKMTGSGNDFVFFDARTMKPGTLETPPVIDAVCDRRRGVGADGIVFVERDPVLPFAIRYFNRDGSLAELCGNASLCAVSLAQRLGIVDDAGDFEFGSSSGPLTGRITLTGPEIDAAPVLHAITSFETSLQPGETRIGFAQVGVPHLVVVCGDVDLVDILGRGNQLRNLPQLKAGANANFLSRRGGGWRMRTYERGVEDETLACGTGAVASAALLQAWGLADSAVTMVTRSGLPLKVRMPPTPERARPSLAGEGRLVYEGKLMSLATTSN
jgi:diaminopimelate epimerase